MKIDTLKLAAIGCIVLSLGLAGGCRTAPRETASPEAEPAGGSDIEMVNQQGKEVVDQARQNSRGTQMNLIHAGDKLTIQIWMKDKISQLTGFPLELEVTESGDVFLPHIGVKKVVERTTEDVQRELQADFSKFLNDSQVIVLRKSEKVAGLDRNTSVTLGNHIILMGWIARPGLYQLTPGMRLRDAMAMAGGFTRYAHHNLFLVRGQRDHPEVVRIKMDDIFLGLDLKQNVSLRPYDAIYVAPKAMWKVADFIGTLLLPIMEVRDAVYVYDRFAE